jgi:hypothetical protein
MGGEDDGRATRPVLDREALGLLYGLECQQD